MPITLLEIKDQPCTIIQPHQLSVLMHVKVISHREGPGLSVRLALKRAMCSHVSVLLLQLGAVKAWGRVTVQFKVSVCDNDGRVGRFPRQILSRTKPNETLQ